jgi:hypothetical protein
MVFSLAEILRLEKFRQADHLRSPRLGLVNAVDGPLQIFFGVGRRRHLDEPDTELFLRQCAAPVDEFAT